VPPPQVFLPLAAAQADARALVPAEAAKGVIKAFWAAADEPSAAAADTLAEALAREAAASAATGGGSAAAAAAAAAAAVKRTRCVLVETDEVGASAHSVAETVRAALSAFARTAIDEVCTPRTRAHTHARACTDCAV
jgi:hypothetical protein